MSETFGQRLARLRVAAGFKYQADLARAIWGERMTPQGHLVADNHDRIYRWEADKRRPNRESVETLAHALRCTVEELEPRYKLDTLPVVRAAKGWARARSAFLALPPGSPLVRDYLNQLAEAEDQLVKSVRTLALEARPRRK